MNQQASPLKQRPTWLESLTGLVPVYSGYADQKKRRESERLYRLHLADRLNSLKQPLDAHIHDLAEAGKVIEALPLERSRSKLDTVEKKVRLADYGHSRFFSNAHLDDNLLDSVYQFDLVLIEQARGLNEQMSNFNFQLPHSDLLQAAEVFEATLAALEAEFDGRCELILNY